MQCCACGALHAVIGPQHLLSVGGGDAVIHGMARVGAGEGDVAGRVPVLREDDVREARGEHVDACDDRIAARHCQRAAGAEIILHVNNDEGVCGLDGDRLHVSHRKLESMAEQSEVPGFNDARVRVRYAETDQMGVVYHSNYLIWFEVGRVELLRSMGFDYKKFETEDGCAIAVVEAVARYKAPARYDDELIIRTTVRAVRGVLIKFGYAVLRAADNVVLCEGETTHVVVGPDMKKRNLPEKYAAALRLMMQAGIEKQGLGIRD